MRAHISNAAFGVLDYAAYPGGMLLLAPAILDALGIDRFGIWALANAVLMTGAILASGFGDANIRSVAQARARGDANELLLTVRSALGIHIVLGISVAGIVWTAAPAIAHLSVKTHGEIAGDCLWSMRITAGLILLRALETVCVSTQRAFDRYGAAIGASVAARILSLLIAWLLPNFSKSVTVILAASLAANIFSLCIQLHCLKRLLGVWRLSPMLHTTATRTLLGFGVFTWLQAASGLLVGQIDRLAAGFALGTSAVAVYAICVQLTQPIYGISAAGLHFVYPLMASDSARGSNRKIRTSILAALAGNSAFVALTLWVLLFFGNRILRAWAGASVADAGGGILPALAWGSALSAFSITGCYALLALGRPKAVAILNVAGALMMVAALPMLIAREGLAGIALSRLLPGCAAMLVYIPLAWRIMKRSTRSDSPNQISAIGGDQRRTVPHTIPYDTNHSFIVNSSIRETARRRYAHVLGVSIDAVDMKMALAEINARLRHGPRGYVCFADVHGILESLNSKAVADAYRQAAMVLPDGTPTMWVGRAQGLCEMNCVTGPGLMNELFRSKEFACYSHFFYGGEPGVAEDLAATLCRQFPWARIAGTYTPPFRDLTPDEEEKLLAEVSRLKPDIMWVGISTPRQDLWMRKMLPRLETRMIFGVGAAFDFLTGRIRLCPDWIKRAGLHWLHRLAQDPVRLWSRNVRNIAFLWHIALQLTGARCYIERQSMDGAARPALIEANAAKREMVDGTL